MAPSEPEPEPEGEGDGADKPAAGGAAEIEASLSPCLRPRA
jgi:hypothetical protein